MCSAELSMKTVWEPLGQNVELKTQAHKISVPIEYARVPLINVHANVSSAARGNNVGLSLRLHLYFVHTNSKYSGESEHMRCLELSLYAYVHVF